MHRLCKPLEFSYPSPEIESVPSGFEVGIEADLTLVKSGSVVRHECEFRGGPDDRGVKFDRNLVIAKDDRPLTAKTQAAE